MRINQTKCSGNSYWSNRLYRVQNEVVESSLPTVTTDDVDMGFSANAHVYGTVVSMGVSDLTSYGFVWSHSDNPTLSDNVSEVGTGPFTGEFDVNIGGLGFPETVYFAAYATNASGTSYGEILSGETDICLAAGTKISLVGGRKKIEDVCYSDDLLVWDFDNANFTSSKPVWMVKPFKSSRYSVVFFDNGSELRTIDDGKGHRIFNVEKGMFTHLMSDDTPVGTTTVGRDGSFVRVVGKEIVKARTTFYNVIANRHMNVFANDILTSTGLNNLYPISGMRFVKEGRSLRKKEEFGVSDELFYGLRLHEQPVSYEGLKEKIDRLVKRCITTG